MIGYILLLGVLASCQAGYTGIGQGFYLPEIALIEDNGSGKSLFKSISPECIKETKSDLNREEKTFFENTEAFYTKLGVESSLSGEVTDGFTLGASIVTASNAIDSKTLDVKGMSMEMYAMTGFWEVSLDCMMQLELDEQFVKSFEALPPKINDPHKKSSWYEYATVLQTYGSHVIKRVSHGSKLTHYVFSKSSEKISSADFLIKVCMAVKDVNLTYCSNFTAEDYAKVTHLATSEEITLRGGSAETRAALMDKVTPQLMEKFMLEANMTDQPISQQYISIWDLLKSRFLGTEHFIKAVNMEAYYLGILNTGCFHQVEEGLELRKFVLVDDNPHAPGYECQLAPKGCRGANDCHIGGMGGVCYCYGPTCINEKTTVDPRHTIHENRYIKRYYDGSSYYEGVNPSCYYHLGVYCECDKNWGGSWKTVWPAPQSHFESDRVLYKTVQAKLMASGAKEFSLIGSLLPVLAVVAMMF